MRFKSLILGAFLLSIQLLSACESCSQESFLSRTSTKAEYAPPTFSQVIFDKSGNSCVVKVHTYILDPHDFIYSGGVMLYQGSNPSSLQDIEKNPIKDFEEDLSKKPHFFALKKFSSLTAQTKFKYSTPFQETIFVLNFQAPLRIFFRTSTVGKSTLLGWLEEHLGYFEYFSSDVLSLSRRLITSVNVENIPANGVSLNTSTLIPAEKGNDITLTIDEISQGTEKLKRAILTPTNGVVLQNVGFKESTDILNLLNIPDKGFSANPCPVSDGHLIFAKKSNVGFALHVEGLSQEQLSALANISDSFSFSIRIIRSEIPAENSL